MQKLAGNVRSRSFANVWPLGRDGLAGHARSGTISTFGLGNFFMRSIAGSALLIASAIFASPCANAAPQSLYGKSIAVTWQEERQQKLEGEEQLRSVGAAAELDVYVSDAGRPFSRLRSVSAATP